MDVLELLRMLRAGESDRIIAQRLHHNRRTVGKYRTWAQEHSLLTGPLPTSREVHQLLTTSMPAPPPPQQTSSVAPYAAEIAAYRARGMEVAAIQTRLQEVHQHSVSYSAVWRFVQHLEPEKPPETFVRVEVKPGSEAQVDFGYGGLTIDPTTGKLRKTWVFVLLLSFSRHEYAELATATPSSPSAACPPASRRTTSRPLSSPPASRTRWSSGRIGSAPSTTAS